MQRPTASAGRLRARRDRLTDVLAGVSAAADAGLAPVKVNAVLMRGINDHEAGALLRFCLDRGYQLRFIEQMPLDAQHGWRRADMVTADEFLASLSAEFALTPTAQRPVDQRPPRPSRSTAARTASGSSVRSPGRSAEHATASG